MHGGQAFFITRFYDSPTGHTTLLRRKFNVIVVDSTSQQRRVSSGSVSVNL